VEASSSELVDRWINTLSVIAERELNK